MASNIYKIKKAAAYIKHYGPDKLDTEDCELAVVMYKRLKKLVARKAVVRGYF